MYVVVLTYTSPLPDVDAVVPDHMAWIRDQYAAGTLLASGRREPRTGGVLLFAQMPRAELDATLARDPFAVHGLADQTVHPFLATSTVDALAPWRDPA